MSEGRNRAVHWRRNGEVVNRLPVEMGQNICFRIFAKVYFGFSHLHVTIKRKFPLSRKSKFCKIFVKVFTQQLQLAVYTRVAC